MEQKSLANNSEFQNLLAQTSIRARQLATQHLHEALVLVDLRTAQVEELTQTVAQLREELNKVRSGGSATPGPVVVQSS